MRDDTTMQINSGKSDLHDELMDGIAKRVMLIRADAAIRRVQCVVRLFVARKRAQKARIRNEILTYGSKLCCDRILDESVMSIILGIVNELMEKKSNNVVISQTVVDICTKLLLEVVDDFVSIIVKETINDCVKRYMEARQKASTNPLVQVILSILEEVILQESNAVIRQAIAEWIDRFLLDRHCEYCYSRIVDELAAEMILPLSKEVHQDAWEVHLRDLLINQVLAEDIPCFVQESWSQYQEDFMHHQQDAQKQIFSKVARDTLGKQLLLQQLIFALFHEFQGAEIRYLARETIKANIISRLACRIEHLERECIPLVESPANRRFVRQLIHSPLEESLFVLWKEASSNYLKETQKLEDDLWT